MSLFKRKKKIEQKLFFNPPLQEAECVGKQSLGIRSLVPGQILPIMVTDKNGKLKLYYVHCEYRSNYSLKKDGSKLKADVSCYDIMFLTGDRVGEVYQNVELMTQGKYLEGRLILTNLQGEKSSAFVSLFTKKSNGREFNFDYELSADNAYHHDQILEVDTLKHLNILADEYNTNQNMKDNEKEL